jgi:hypothetical protein
MHPAITELTKLLAEIAVRDYLQELKVENETAQAAESTHDRADQQNRLPDFDAEDVR